MKLGFDVGGTAIKYGIVSEAGELLCSDKVPTPKEDCGREIPALLLRLYRELAEKFEISGIGIGVPGTVDPKAGVVLYSANLKGFSGANFKDAMQETLLPIAVENDVNVQAMGEYSFGAAKGCEHFLMISLGTGLGGAIVSNGRPVSGHTHGAGEFGHMVIERGGKLCECGKKGCFQTYCSARALLIRYSERKKTESSLEDFFRSLNGEEKEAMAVYDEYLEYMGIGLSNLIHAFDPDRILIGGGISEVPRLVEDLRNTVPNYLFPSYAKGLDLVAAELGNRAGIMGAAAMMMRDQK